ncbi:MAG: cyclic nucleotide-binding domain-containing protein [Nitrospirota bacterium]
MMKEGELGRLYTHGEVIFKEGDKGDVMYVIQSGKVDIMKNTPEGEVCIATLGSGEIFGEMALFDRLPRSANAVASGRVQILSVDRKKLFSTISRDPTLVFKIIESMSQRIRALNEEMTKLKKAGTGALKITFNLEEICRLVLDEARNIVRAENGSLMLLDEDESSLSIMAAYGKKSDKKISLKKGVGIAGDVLSTGRSELVNNVSFDSRFISGKMQIKSLLCAPLKCRDYVFGVINLSDNREKVFTLDDLKLLNSLSFYASIAIQNARNFNYLKNAADGLLRHASVLNIM